MGKIINNPIITALAEALGEDWCSEELAIAPSLPKDQYVQRSQLRLRID